MTNTLNNETFNEESDDEYIAYVDEHDEPTGADDAGGTTDVRLSLPDQAPRAELIAAIATAVAQALESERKTMQQRRQGYLENQAAGFVAFARYGLAAGQAVQIMREKEFRAESVVVCYTPSATVYVGKHAGIMVGGTDTAAIVGSAGGTAREIKTTEALWAIADIACTIDVQEEYGG